MCNLDFIEKIKKKSVKYKQCFIMTLTVDVPIRPEVTTHVILSPLSVQ